MAEKRMFAKTIITSDAFLDMPMSARFLYILLAMMADDDGFVNSPKSIMRQAGASIDDMNILIAKRYILTFESGVVVIKHWCIHNTIKKDRYKETTYLEEKAQLVFDDKNAYTERVSALGTGCIQDGNEVEPTWNHTGSKVEPQNRIEEIRRDKNSIEEGGETAKPTPQQIVDLYHSICVSFPSVRVLSDARKKAIKARLNTYTLDDFKQCFENAEASSFLKGSNPRNWQATFDWLIKDSNMAKVLDGNYADKAKPEGGSEGFTSFDADQFFRAAKRRSEAQMHQSAENPKTAGNDETVRERVEALKQKFG